AAFFALGAYTSVVLIKGFAAPLPVLLAAGAAVAGLLGLGIGYLTLRLRGVFFSIATLALAVVLQTMVINWDYVGGARGISVVRPGRLPFFGSYVEFLFAVMLLLAIFAIAVAWWIETSRIGRGLAAIGAILLGTTQQVATVTISSALNLLIVGIILVAFVILAPDGILGLVQRLKGGARA